MEIDRKIVDECLKGRASAQRRLYESCSGLLLGLCMRYTSSREEAEDVLQEGFVKIFRHIGEFKGDGSIMAWMRRIMINTAITHYHKMRKHRYHEDLDEVRETRFEEHVWSDAEFTGEELFGVIQRMPDGYRVVFSLYAIEGYKHREIAELLDIDENTSKSQYSRGRRWLQERLLKIRDSEESLWQGTNEEDG